MNIFAEMVTGVNAPNGSKILDKSCNTNYFVDSPVSTDFECFAQCVVYCVSEETQNIDCGVDMCHMVFVRLCP